MLGNEIVVGVTLHGYGGKHVTCFNFYIKLLKQSAEQDSVAGLSRLGKFLKLELLTIIDHYFKVFCFVHSAFAEFVVYYTSKSLTLKPTAYPLIDEQTKRSQIGSEMILT